MDEEKFLRNGHLAYEFKDRVTEPRARGALCCVHHVLLECFVAPLHYLTERLRPEKPIDNLSFFQAVASTFATWDEALTQSDLAPTENPQVINTIRGLQLANSLPSIRATAILRHFIRVTTGMKLPPGASIDLDFCCRLVAAFVVRDDVLNDVLSGAIAKDLDQYQADPDAWIANAWFQKG
jgi:hypothetical protein